VQIVILDHVRIQRPNALDEPSDQIRFRRTIEHFGDTRVIANRHHEDPVMVGVEAGRLEVELEAVNVIERQSVKVRSPREHQVLLVGRQREHRLRFQLGQLARFAHGCAQSFGRGAQQRVDERSPIVGTHEIPQRPGPIELPAISPRHASEVVEMREENPGSKALRLDDQRVRCRVPPPDECFAAQAGMYRNDAGRGVPAPHPLIS
jgi:hypothetical protein